jgi:hypothetical protein
MGEENRRMSLGGGGGGVKKKSREIVKDEKRQKIMGTFIPYIRKYSPGGGEISDDII